LENSQSLFLVFIVFFILQRFLVQTSLRPLAPMRLAEAQTMIDLYVIKKYRSEHTVLYFQVSVSCRGFSFDVLAVGTL
jgi:hypothetical protein